MASTMMNVGEAPQPSSIIEARQPQHTPDLTHYPRHAHSHSTSSNTSSTAGRSRASSITPQQVPPAAVPRSQEASHIRFKGATTPQNSRGGIPQDSEPTPQPQIQDPQRSAVPPPPSPRLHPTHPSNSSLNESVPSSPKIRVKDLRHIQSFASEEVLTRSRHPSKHSLRGRLNGGQQYEISSMPVTDIIEMVAGLLTKITTKNDKEYENLHRNVPPPEGSAPLSQQASSVLAFHGKNVPAITIASYLTRIHKYCPTTYEVFLSLLVYFDRMTQVVNNGSNSPPPEDEFQQGSANKDTSTGSYDSGATFRQDSPMDTSPSERSNPSGHPPKSTQSANPLQADVYDISHYFVVDSFNIHRLVMAAVTCASKFFSDVFYTNSRYAKVSLPSLST